MKYADQCFIITTQNYSRTALQKGLCMIPRNKCPRFSASVARRSPILNSARISSSSISLNALSPRSNSSIEKLKSRSVVRAEAEGDAEAGEESSESVDAPEVESAESEAGADAEVAEKPPRKPRIKLGDIMGILNKRAIDASEKERPIPDLRTGDVVQIKLEVPENKRRLSLYKGIVISKQNAGIHTTIRIRRIIAGIGVEIVFPIYSPNIKEIRVMSHRKVRRARLYYLRDKLPRLSTFK